MSRPLILLVVTTVALTGCTSIRGMQERVGETDLGHSICPTAKQAEAFEAEDGPSRGAYRNRVVSDCVSAIDLKYEAFKASLHGEVATSRLGTDIPAVALTTAAALAKGGATKTLAGLAGLSLAVGATIDKDIYYQTTLPALEAAMDAKRDKVLTDVLDAENADPRGTSYSLDRAGAGLRAYQAAGNIYSAIAELNKAASDAAAEARKARVSSESAGVLIGPLTDAQDSRIDALDRKINALKEPADDAKLDSVIAKLGTANQTGKSFKEKRTAAKLRIEERVGQAVDKDAELTAIETAVKPALP